MASQFGRIENLNVLTRLSTSRSLRRRRPINICLSFLLTLVLQQYMTPCWTRQLIPKTGARTKNKSWIKFLELKPLINRMAELMYVYAVDFWTYLLNDWQIGCEKSVFHWFLNILKKLCLQLNPQNFDLADPISILGFLMTFKLTCDASRIHGFTALRALPSFVADLAASFLNCSMLQSDGK